MPSRRGRRAGTTGWRMNTAVMHLDVAPATLDPARSTDYVAAFVAAALYEPLVRVSAGGRVTPGLVSGIHHDRGAGTLRMRLREAAWSDGQPCTAHDVRRAWQRLESLDDGSLRSLLRLLLGPALVRDAVRVAGPLTLEVALRPGGSRFLPVLGSLALAPVRDPEQPWATTLGPYAAVAPVGADGGLDLVANRHRPAPAHRVGHLRMEVVPDPDDSLDTWLAGGCDVTCNTMFPFGRAADDGVREHLLRGPLPLIGVVSVNPALRRRPDVDLAGLNAAVPRAALATALHGGVEPLYGYWPGGPPSRVATTPPARPPATPAGPPLRLAVSDHYPNVAVCTALAAAWGARGVPVEVDVVGYRDLAATTGTHDLTYRIQGLPYPRAESTLLAVDLTALGAPPAIIRARQAVVTGDRPAGAAAARSLTDFFDASPPHLPVLRLRSFTAVGPRLTGLTIDPLGVPDFSALARQPGRAGAHG